MSKAALNLAQIVNANIQLPSSDLVADIRFFTKQLGFQLETIYPADNPAIAQLFGYGLRIELNVKSLNIPGSITLTVNDFTLLDLEQCSLTAPNGTIISLVDANPPLIQPATEHEFSVCRLADKGSWGIGRAGMRYRDLIPSRLGDAIIASHIHIPTAGLVPDMVHYHEVGFQLIFCYRGWVKVVYEDQGEPIIMRPGDCVIQPPEIRHRVLESGDDLQVLEIGVPAEHITKIDSQMTLPNAQFNPQRMFHGSRFVHHIGENATWQDWRIPGFKAQKTGIAQATQGIADVQVVSPIAGSAAVKSQHDGDIVFTFIKEGAMTLEVEGIENSVHQLSSGDAFIMPPNTPMSYKNCSSDCELIEVTLAASFNTTVL
ncbi:MAG: cupin domain-containing protein [Oceanospirillaceae bacterium]